jgi:hypothetical protein
MAFFNFFVGVFQEYEDFIIPPPPGGQQQKAFDVNACYNFNKYIETTSRPDQKPFFKNFL